MAKEKPAERIIKKTGDSHVIWFSESNKWIEFKEPAWFIYQKYINREDEDTITVELSRRYGLKHKEAKRFLCEIIEGIKEASRRPGDLLPGPHKSPEEPAISQDPKSPGEPATSQDQKSPEKIKQTGVELLPFTTRYYLINSKNICITYGSPAMEYYFHRPLAHLETVKKNEPELFIELYEHQSGSAGKYILRKKLLTIPQPSPRTIKEPRKSKARVSPAQTGITRISEGSWEQMVFDETGFLKHHLYTEISNLIYDIPGESWMSYIHASAVTNKKEAILFCSSSGSGKSTLAALLQLPGHKYSNCKTGNENLANQNLSPDNGRELFFMSDDFIPVDAINMKAHIFPAAITIKEGSFPVISRFYESWADADAAFGGIKSSRIRYLRPRFPESEYYLPQPVKKIIFVRYDPGTPFKMDKLPVIKALTMFHEEAWVSHNPDHARNFIDWFVTLNCYTLRYSDIKKAREEILKLFEI